VQNTLALYEKSTFSIGAEKIFYIFSYGNGSRIVALVLASLDAKESDAVCQYSTHNVSRLPVGDAGVYV
jgi:hypothetical protein